MAGIVIKQVYEKLFIFFYLDGTVDQVDQAAKNIYFSGPYNDNPGAKILLNYP